MIEETRRRESGASATWSATAPSRTNARPGPERCAVCLVGNHDLAALDQLDIRRSRRPRPPRCSGRGRRKLAPTAEFLAGLEPSYEAREVALYHASPRDPIWEYVLWPDQAAQCIAVQSRRVSLIGHSHVALFFALADPRPGAGIRRRLAAPRRPPGHPSISRGAAG